MSTVTPTTYRAAVVRNPAGPDSIEIVERPLVDPGPGEILVKVAAAAVNPVDVGVVTGVVHRLGLVHQPEWTGLGWDFAGTVAAVGEGVDLTPGARVAGVIEGFDRDFGTYAEYLIAPLGSLAVVPDDVDLLPASTVPLNGLAGSQIVDLLGDAPTERNRLLVTGAAGAVGAYAAALGGARGWQVTGLARDADEPFVRSLGVGFTSHAEPGWDAVVDGAVMQRDALDLVSDGGTFVGVQPASPLQPERGITVKTVVATADSERLAELLQRTAAKELPARVQAELPLDEAADALRAVARGGIRGRYVLRPWEGTRRTAPR